MKTNPVVSKWNEYIDQRVNIKHLQLKQQTSTQVHHDLIDILGKAAVSNELD